MIGPGEPAPTNSMVPLEPRPRAVMNRSSMNEALLEELDRGNVKVETDSV